MAKILVIDIATEIVAFKIEKGYDNSLCRAVSFLQKWYPDRGFYFNKKDSFIGDNKSEVYFVDIVEVV